MRLFKKFQCDKCEKKFSHQEDLMHHELRTHCEDSRYDCKVCNEYFDSMESMRDHLKKKGTRILGEGEPKIGAHDTPVLFLHPKDFCGTLIELEEA